MNLYSQFPEAWKLLWNDQTHLQKLFQTIESKIEQDAKKYKGLSIYPPTLQILECFQYFSPNDTKVIILGQDCYHGPDQATGLCFAVPNGSKIPPSLRNIIKECRSQCGNENVFSTDLIHWAKQGILLLNCALTVRQSGPGSHLAIWKPFIEELLQNISEQVNNMIFLLWGGFAKNKRGNIKSIDTHHLLEANHPSPLSANRGGWFGNDHFNQVNQILKTRHKTPIQWTQSN